MSKPDDKECALLKTILDSVDQEDESVRQRQIRIWRKMKLMWEGFSNIWWSEVAHDWRIWDQDAVLNDNQASYYDKPVNVFRTYLETIIAALSVTVPPVTCYPDDADNPLDLQTARAGNKIAQLIYRHNDVSYLWLHALFIFCTEGLVFNYTYPKEDEAYGTYDKKEYAEDTDMQYVCPMCQQQLEEALFNQQPEVANELRNLWENINLNEKDEFMPDDDDVALHDILFNENQIVCPHCSSELDPSLEKSPLVVTRLVGVTKEPKTRQCMEVYGGLYVKVPNYVMKQEDLTYLRFSYEAHFGNILERYPFLRDEGFTVEGAGRATGPDDPYEQWGRLNPQYRGEYPRNTTTVNNYWIRPAQFNILNDDKDVKYLKKKYPDGCKAVKIQNKIVDATNESLDDCWTLTRNPLSDYLHHDPLGLLLVSIQDITNTLISLTLQTIEHGVPQTFASPNVLNFNQYAQLEVTPGQVIPTKGSFNKPIGEGFYEVKTATLSQEVLPFANKMQEMGQLVVGALPSLFGGQLDGSKTASEYSMSRAQALQRLQNTWKIFTQWWKTIFGKAIPSFIDNLQDDERFVTRDNQGNFLNVFIRKAELQGKIGQVELEANEQLPITWSQQRDVLMQLLQTNNEMILSALSAPENREVFRQAIGLTEFRVPGEQDRENQNSEINELMNSEPMFIPTPEVDPMSGKVIANEQELPSVEIEPDLDNHEIHIEVARAFLISDAGRLAKIDNPLGYRNVLLHLKQHQMFLQSQMMQQQMSASEQTEKPENKKPRVDNAESISTES